MKYDKFFSEDVGSFMRSPVREIFKKVDLASIYSFAGGYPDAATFPIEDIRRISAQVLDRYGAKALQYGATQGVPELRQVISDRYGVPVENVQVTTSSQQGIDVCTRVLANPGDVILTTTFASDAEVVEWMRAQAGDTLRVEEFGGDAPARYLTLPGFPSKSVAFGSDAPHLTNFAQKIICGPGSITVAHRDDEFLSFAELGQAITNYVSIFESVAL